MKNVYDLVIIGGGPAGITAGIYAARKKMKSLLISKDFLGQVSKTSEVDNWPGKPAIQGIALIKSFEEHLKKFEIGIEQGLEVNKILKKQSFFLIKTKEKKQFLSKTVIAATGAKPRHLNIKGEKELLGKGVSFCSVCDAPFFKNKRVVVVGGGNSGFEAALDLAKYAQKVFIFEYSNKSKADGILQAQAKNKKNIEIFFNRKLKSIEGSNKTDSIIYQDLLSKKTFQMPIEGVFVEIGYLPSVDFLKGLVNFNKLGQVEVNAQTCQTSQKGIFAAGDLNSNQWKQIITAASDGCRAALFAYQYLQKNGKT